MLFTIKKFIEPFLVPPGIFVFLLIVSGLLISRKSARAGMFNILIGLLMWAMSAAPVSDALARGLESGLKVPANPHGDVIIVLGGGMSGDKPSQDTTVRLMAAVKLYRIIHAPIIVSGGSVSPHEKAEAPVDARELAELGIPVQKIIMDDKSRDTLGNAINSKKICLKSGFKSPVVVTSAIHMKRALQSFKDVNMDVSYYPAGPLVQRKAYGWQGWIPQSMEGSAKALHEYAGILYLKALEKTGLKNEKWAD